MFNRSLFDPITGFMFWYQSTRFSLNEKKIVLRQSQSVCNFFNRSIAWNSGAVWISRSGKTNLIVIHKKPITFCWVRSRNETNQRKQTWSKDISVFFLHSFLIPKKWSIIITEEKMSIFPLDTAFFISGDIMRKNLHQKIESARLSLS